MNGLDKVIEHLNHAHRHHIKHFLSVRPYYKGIDYYVARMSSIICTPAVLQLREFL